MLIPTLMYEVIKNGLKTDFYIYITLPFAKLCYAFEEKLFFSVIIILWKKAILSCLKMTLKISPKLR